MFGVKKLVDMPGELSKNDRARNHRSYEWSPEALVWKKWEKNKEKMKKEGHIGNLSDMTGANILWHSTFKIGEAHFRIFACSVVTVNRAEITALMYVRTLSLYVISGVLKWIWDTVILFDK